MNLPCLNRVLLASLIFGVFPLLLSVRAEAAEAFSPRKTFCNPLNLDYGPGNATNGSRHGADPVIVLFKGKYYLFDSWDQYGYRVSEDLIHWSVILFDEFTLPLASTLTKEGKMEIIAPAVATDGKYVYYTTFANKHILRSSDPASGKWEQYAKANTYSDPDLFIDDDGKFYMFWGMCQTYGSELNPMDFQEVKGSKKVLTADYRTAQEYLDANPPYGLLMGKRVYNHQNWDLPGTLDTEKIIPALTHPDTEPMQEGSWMTKHKGRYYLQNANPDTACPWYSDSVWEADSIAGPYHLADYAPASMKVGGFINSTGHSCVFQDKFKNWWRVTTMWIGVYGGFERRIGLFPAGFDAQGRMYTRTALGDYPMMMPNGPFDPNKHSVLAGWFVLSTGKACTASSTLDSKHGPEMAADENVRTWWSAKTSGSNEWFQMDLGAEKTVHALQVNFAEQNAEQSADDYTRYQLLLSKDGKEWSVIADKSANKTATPHDYVPLDKAMRTRYVKVINVHSAKNGKFALRDLRVFGNGGGERPAQASELKIARWEDARHVTFTWKPAPGAEGYLIHFGVAPDALHLNLQVQGGALGRLTVSCLNRDAQYFYRIDAYNENGVTPGIVTQTAQ